MGEESEELEPEELCMVMDYLIAAQQYASATRERQLEIIIDKLDAKYTRMQQSPIT